MSHDLKVGARSKIVPLKYCVLILSTVIVYYVISQWCKYFTHSLFAQIRYYIC